MDIMVIVQCQSELLQVVLALRSPSGLTRLLDGWQKQGHELVSLGSYLESLAVNDLPRHEIATGPIPGRSGVLALQGREFLAST